MLVTSGRQLIFSVFAIVVLALLASVVAWYMGPASQRILVVFFVSLIAVVAIGVYSGNSGILSFGHVSFMAIGAYASSLLTVPAMMKAATLPKLPEWLASTEMGLLPAIVIALLFTALIAVVTGVIFGKLEGSAATIATLGLLIITHGVIIGWRDVTRGSGSFFGVPRETTLVVAMVGAVVALVVARLYRDSISGLKLRASRENAIAASAVGVNIRRERLIAWVLSAMLMALSGALMAHFLGAFSPKSFYFTVTFHLLAMLIVGGMTTVTGAIAGSVLITIVTEILRHLEGGFSLGFIDVPQIFGTTQIGIALLILFAMFKKSDGLLGLKEWEERLIKFTHPAVSQQSLGAVEPAGFLTAQGMTMRFGGLTAVDKVDFLLKPGEIVGLIGPNGSGKTTLLNMLSGVLEASEGTFKIGDIVLDGVPSHFIAEHGIARTFQNIRLFGHLSVYQNVLVAALSTNGGEHAHGRTQSALARMGMSQFADMEAGTLSYGDQRRVEIARALACQPSLLFLDEPAAGMNREETDALMDMLRSLTKDLGIGILLVDHDLKLINQLCDRISVLNEGKLIAQGTPAEIRKNPAVIEAYLGTSSEQHQ
ncbi:branched-chain amino acid ABC transporter ATP-binding protein/permease [Cohaesibacter celericrescens]|uniref:ABC transporter n=1 Tax=Cohaesibacter celericrescens TaxID=2067669 RepID=A0A2N5XW80_9HYPH|nr:branched-chain amino acid ABC transporter ATP-binding protein/permease [Cohaesibacter celericrescens]PLW78761.1 ABC transporter [Cohaesibacter celericrescens]